jgi:hypothetical protein
MKNHKLKRLTILLLGLFILTGLIAQKPDKKYKPKNLEEAISQLDILLTEKDKKNIYDMTEKDYTTNSHFSTGMWIRNNWGLWDGQELSKYFNALGIYHPDDMSGIILCSYYRHIHSQDYKIEEQIKNYQDYWKEFQELGQRLKTDTAFARQERLKFEESVREKKEKQKQSFPTGSKIKAWVDYTSGGLKTQIEGNIVEWREVEEKGKRISPDGTYFKLKDVEAKIKVTTFIDKTKKKRVEKQNQMTTDELWVNIEQLEKTE